MKRLITVLFLFGWLGGCTCAVMPVGPQACPPGHRPGGLHPSQAAALRNHLKHGYHNLEKGKCDKAQAEFAQALEIDPGNPDARVGWEQADACGKKGKLRGRAR